MKKMYFLRRIFGLATFVVLLSNCSKNDEPTVTAVVPVAPIIPVTPVVTLPTNGLVAWYPFNGNANDESGNGNNGIVNGGVSLTIDRNNAPNRAYLWPFFGGQNNFISIGNIHYFIPNSLSFCAWIFMDGGSLGPRIISSGEVGIGTPTTTNGTRVFNVNYATSQINSVNIPALSWQHIVYTFNVADGTSRFYVNGVQTNFETGGTRTSYSYVNWNIGRKSIPAFDSWGGKIDNVGIWNRALTSTEVQQLYVMSN